MIPHSYDENGNCTSCDHSIEYYEIASSINMTFDSTNHKLIISEDEDSYSIEIEALYTTRVEFDYSIDDEPSDSSLEVLIDSSTEYNTNNPETDYSGSYSATVSAGSTITIVFNKGTDGKVLEITNFCIKYGA